MWVVGADMDGECDYDEANLTGPLVLVVGGEGHGIGRLTKENCDFLVRLPMKGRINSLNASVAGSILMYEAMRQRLKGKRKLAASRLDRPASGKRMWSYEKAAGAFYCRWV